MPPPPGRAIVQRAMTEPDCHVDLYWLPLGAGGQCVRMSGHLYEALTALPARRRRCDLYHSALVVAVPEGTYAIESAPARADGADRGVVGDGPVGSRRLGRLRLFRYELRCARDGTIPDLAEAVDSPRRLSADERGARRIVALTGAAPLPVWGRDEARAGDMWNSNSYIAWLIERAGLDAAAIRPPTGGRAPGWSAGVVVARRARPRERDPGPRVAIDTAAP
jgi:hypothetical protein